MTAKEYVTECTPFNAPNREKFIEAVTQMLQDFATLKCKEQMELDAMLYRDIMYEALGNKNITHGEMVERIRNNKQPEV